MALTAYKFDCFWEDLAEQVHDLQNDTFKVGLSNTAPTVATDDEWADITEISAGNGYIAGGGAVTVSGSSQTGGLYTWEVDFDYTVTASGGSIAPFRYYVLYNDSATNDELICYWDLGSSVTLNSGDNFTLDMGTVFTLT